MARDTGFGILLIVATALTISVQDLVFKLFSGDLGLWQIFAVRGVLAIAALLTLSALRGQIWTVARMSLSLWPVLRGLCLTATFLAFYAAIPVLSLSVLGAANYTAPLFVALMSACVLGEPVRRLGWIGVCLGFVGVLFLLQPGTEAFSGFALLPLGGAVSYAIAHTITRAHCRQIPVAALALSANVMMCLSGFAMSLVLMARPAPIRLATAHPFIFGPWAGLEVMDWGVLALLAGFTVAIGMMLAAAYRAAPPTTVATFEYSYLVFVALWDIWIFGLTPTSLSLSGMALIVLAGGMVLRRPP